MYRRIQLLQTLSVTTQRAAEGELHPEDGATASATASPICHEVRFVSLLITSQSADHSRFRPAATAKTEIASRENQTLTFFKDIRQATM